MSSRRNTAMKPPTPIYFTIRNERERAEFLEAGVDLPKGKVMEGGEFIRFEISEDDPRWESFARIFRKRLATDVDKRVRKSTIPPLKPRASLDGNAEWLDGYSGQTVEQLLSLEGKCRTDSLVLAFEQAISQKAESANQGLTNPEHIVLAVEALEREVNNGGYDQFRGSLPLRLWGLSDASGARKPRASLKGP